MPERFGRQRKYALGKTSGKANIENNLQQLGIRLSEDDLRKVTQKIIELGDKKEMVTQADLPYIISDILDSNTIEQKVQIEDYVLTHAKHLKPSATLRISVHGEQYEEHAQGDGQYDAFMNALKKVYKKRKEELPQLTDYTVRIPPGVRPMRSAKPSLPGAFPTSGSSRPAGWTAIRPFRPSRRRKKC